jgi:hypothetical protein
VAQSFIFINYEQALRFGHVAWGFALSDGNTYCWGSSDHLLRRPMTDIVALVQYSHVPPGGDIDFWCEQGSFEQMLESMSQGHHIQHQEMRYHINYHAYKKLHHDGGNPERALQELELIKAGGWSLLTNNCIDQTYRLLDAYGSASALVDPKLRYRSGRSYAGQEVKRMSTLLPRKWFAAARGESFSLEQYKLRAKSTSACHNSQSQDRNSETIGSNEQDSNEQSNEKEAPGLSIKAASGRQIVG